MMSDEFKGWRYLLRTEQLDNLELRIKQCRHCMAIGLPGCGKSVFLDQFAEKVGNNFLVLVVDVDSELNFLSQLVEKLKRSIFDSGLSLDGQCINDNPAMELVEVLRKAHSISGKRVVVVIKSFEQVRKLDEGERASVGNNLYYAFNSASVKTAEGPTLILGSDRELYDVMAGAQRCKTKFEAMFGSKIYLHPFDLPQTVELLKLNGCEDLAVCEWLHERTGGNPLLMKLYYDEALGRKLDAALLGELSTSPTVSCYEERWVENVRKLLGELKERDETLFDALGGMLAGTPLSNGCRRMLVSAYGLISGNCQIPSVIKRCVTGYFNEKPAVSKNGLPFCHDKHDSIMTTSSNGNDSAPTRRMGGISSEVFKTNDDSSCRVQKFREEQDAIFKAIRNGSREPILILGEKGTGKTTFVDEILKVLRETNPDMCGRVVRIDAGNLSAGNLQDLRLFGAVPGGHSTWPSTKKEIQVGAIESADKGILFVDEIGNATPDLQMKLLKVLKEKTFCRLGSAVDVKVDFFLVCATNENVLNNVNFRGDLLRRIDTYHITMPNLADRREEITCKKILEIFNRYLSENNKARAAKFDETALQKYQQFASSPKTIWKDNWDGLEKSIKRMVDQRDGETIDTKIVEEEIVRCRGDEMVLSNLDTGVGSVAGSDELLLDLIERFKISSKHEKAFRRFVELVLRAPKKSRQAIACELSEPNLTEEQAKGRIKTILCGNSYEKVHTAIVKADR